MNELKKLAMYKVEGEDFADDDFIVFLHMDNNFVVLIELNDDEINQINLAGLEDSVLDINVDDLFLQKKVLILYTKVDENDHAPIDIDAVEQIMGAQLFYSSIVNEAGIDKLMKLIKDSYISKVSIAEFENQVFEVEGIKIDLVNKNVPKFDKDDTDYLMIDAYPYTVPMDGEATIDELKNERIYSLIDTIVPKKWW